MTNSITLDDLTAARALVARHVAPTTQYCWPLLATEPGVRTWVKHENHTPTGAFKVRGGLVCLDRLMQRVDRPTRLITATRGNHGQSIPCAARLHGIPVTVLVPEGNSADKSAAMCARGAELEVFGRDFDTARQEAERRAKLGMGEIVPSFHDELIPGVVSAHADAMARITSPALPRTRLLRPFACCSEPRIKSPKVPALQPARPWCRSENGGRVTTSVSS